MANSKSNIYPIQLQGAELNLNKYDAEIKQYSGFNKNNSPFVGGCLSNVLKKDVTIEGENFIDKKGNIYAVDTEGVYLNGSKIINYSEHTRFYKKTKLNVPDNAVMAISDDIYITLENNLTFPRPMTTESNEYGEGYVVHWGDGYSQVLAPASTTGRVTYDIVKKGDVVVFNCKRNYNIVKNTYTYIDFMYTIIVPDINVNDCKVYTPSYGLHYAPYYYGCSKTSGNPSVYITDNEILISNNTTSEYGIYIFNLDGSFRYVGGYKQPVLGLTYLNAYSSYVNLPPIELRCWYMTNDGYLWFRANYGDYTFDSSLTGVKSFYYSVKIDHVDNDVIYVRPKNDFYIYNAAGKTIASPQNVFTSNNLKPYFPFFNLILQQKDDRSKGYVLSACGSFQNAAVNLEEISSYKYIKVDKQNGVYFFGDFKILVNNGEISNISVAEFKRDSYNIGKVEPYEGGSLNGVILEDWNSIDKLLITEDGQKAVYKKSDGFYAIERTATPVFFLKNNQLVINCNNEYNSINIDTGEILHFGSDWNDSYLSTPGYGGDSTTYIYDSLFDRYNYDLNVTSSVNEQEFLLNKNASALFNPRPVKFLNGYVKNFMASDTSLQASVICRDFISNGAVNFYSGNDTEVLFVCSSNYSTEHREKLEGLPFPTDTNGNVLLNAPLFSDFISTFSNDVFVKIDNDAYALHKSNNQLIMSYYVGTLVENLENLFILQGQYYGIINKQLFSIQISGGIVVDMTAIVSVQGLQFVGNTPYEALFFSKTNRCLYSFTGANVLNQKQLVDKISEVRNYLYNPATQTVFLITDIGVLFYGLFGIYLLEYTDITQVYLLLNGVVLGNNTGLYHYLKYYLDEGDEGYEKQNIRLETCFYGMNNEVVTINDCLYFRLFSEEHEEGNLKVSATTISLKGRQTEETTFKIKASDWDKITHTIYLRYQPKTQRGLGVSFSIDSPFKIASMSVGSQPDAVLVDRVSKGAITAPSVTTNNNEW